MCGRFASAKHDTDLIAEAQPLTVVGEEPLLSWNVAPTQDVRVVLERPGPTPEAPPERQLRTLRWGLIPSWAGDPGVGSRMINARRETLTDRRAFRAALAGRRCLIPASGYFEWERRPGESRTVPTYLHLDGSTAWFAGLYDGWRDPQGGADPWVRSFTIITTAAPDALGHIHHRSPVVLPPDRWSEWLDPRLRDPGDALQILLAVPEPVFSVRVVSPAVGNHRNNGPQLIQAVT